MLLFCFFSENQQAADSSFWSVSFALRFPLTEKIRKLISFFALDLDYGALSGCCGCDVGFYCIWLKGKTSFMCLRGRCRFRLSGKFREESSLLASFFLSFFLFYFPRNFNSFFLIYNNFLIVNYGLHVWMNGIWYVTSAQ